MTFVQKHHDNIVYTVQLLAECIAKHFNTSKTLTDDETTDKMVQLTRKLIAYDASKMSAGRYKLFASNLCAWMTYLVRFDGKTDVLNKINDLVLPNAGLMFELWVASGRMSDRGFT